MRSSDVFDCDVVVVGAGPVGLALTLALSRAGVDVIALDRDSGPSTYPKSRVIGARSMELLRRWGLAAEVRDAALGSDWCHRIVVARSLAGTEIARVEQDAAAAEMAHASSPEGAVLCTQDKLEAILSAAVGKRYPQTLRWNSEVAEVVADEDGVRVELTDASGARRRLRGRYAVCADGVRGIGSSAALPGAGKRRTIARQVSVRVTIDLAQWIEQRPAFIYYVVDRGVSAQVLVVDGQSDWVICALARREESPADYPEVRVRELIATVVGLPASDSLIASCAIRDVRVWELALRVAEQFRCGRILRAGDAAHEVLPTGAMGLNLGIADADALAWRLAGLVHGWAETAILDGYDAERRGIAERTAAWTRANLNTVANILGAAAREEDVPPPAAIQELGVYVDHPGLDLGPLLPPALNDAARLVDDGRPGSRGPHIPLGRSGYSTLDLYGIAPVLLVDRSTGAAADCGRRAGVIAGVPLSVVSLARQTRHDAPPWWSRHGVTREGAILVRPDGYVCWSVPCIDELSVDALSGALSDLAGRASIAAVGAVGPDVTEHAHTTGVRPGRAWANGRPVVLIFHGRDNQDAARAVVQTVRNTYTHAASVVTVNIVDVSMFPRTMRRLVRSDLDKAFDHEVANLPGDRDPESHIVIVADHNGALTRSWGFRDTDRVVSCVILDADWRIRLRAAEPALDRAVMRTLGGLVSGT